MLYNFQRKKLYGHLLVGGALCAASLGMFSCSDKYDLDSEQPSGLNSIYNYLEEQGNFTNCMQLIRDLGQKDVLSLTGSKTMFIADDDAFNRFFASNKWGVHSYGELTTAQKKLLLNSAMIDNPYSTSMLSTAEGPVKGEVCRRNSSVTIYDSVLAVPVNDPEGILPHNDRFDELRASTTRSQNVLFTDYSGAGPIIHFNAKFLTSNKVQSSDVDFVYNQPSGTRASDDVYVNNAKIIDANIFCKNGFIHKVDEVILPLDNMAEVIRQKPQVSIYNSILERFAVPYFDATFGQTRAYTENKQVDIDSVFTKRFFADRSAGSSSSTAVPLTLDRHAMPMEGGASLKFDPGWNAYVPAVANDRDGMMEDLAVMLVPTDDAIREWWNNGNGKPIKEFYGTIENTPSSVLDNLVNVNMLNSFIQSVPSRFADVLDDANEYLGITTDDVDSVFQACNGLIYLTNKVFSPKSYSSVLFPAVVDTTSFCNIENGISNLQYDAYLNSMVAKYIFLLPTNEALLSYIDPVSYGRTGSDQSKQLWEFQYDPTKPAYQKLSVAVWNTDAGLNKSGTRAATTLTGGTGSIDNNGRELAGNSAIKNRVTELLDNVIITEAYVPGKKFYKTKGNNFVRVDGITEGSSVSGSFQQDLNTPITVKQAYNMGNGVALVLDQVAMTTPKSVAMTLQDYHEFTKFYEILSACGALSKQNSQDNWLAGDQTYGNLFNLKQGGSIGAEDIAAGKTKATYLLNNYHYTLYAPTDEAMDIAFAKGLPDLNALNDAEAYDAAYNAMTEAEQAAYLEANPGFCPGDSADRVKEVMLDFVKYHIQDNSIYVDNGFDAGEYETGKTALTRSTSTKSNGEYTKIDDNTIQVGSQQYAVKKWQDGFVEYYDGKYSPGRPYKINVSSVSSGGMTISDNVGGVAHVVTAGNAYNLTAREYWYTGSTSNQRPYQLTLDNSSSVVIHAIDAPLIYADGQHRDSNGDLIETQFTYKYRTLSN